MNFGKLSLLAFFLILCGVQCKKSAPTNTTVVSGKEIVTNAEGLSIKKYENFSIVTISNSFPNSTEAYTYIFHKKNALIPDSLAKFTSLEVPVKNIIVTSTTHIPSLDMLDEMNSLVAFPNTNYISTTTARKRIEEGKIREIGTNQSLNTEVIIDMQPDVVVGFSVDGDKKAYTNLEKNGIKILFNSDWTEKTPLGKAEWIKLFGALFDKNKEAETIFNTIKTDYLQAVNLAKKATTQPTILSGSIYQDRWYLPQGNSWGAYFFNEANGNYLWKNTTGTGSLALSFETVLEKGKNADFWIGPGQFTRIDELLKSNENYRYFKAVQNKEIYSFSTKKGKTGGVIYYELAPNRPDLVLKDLIKILHPEVLPNYELYFFEKLN
ncbi:ABC transporter substrate-binding protein [Flavobacterium sp.]|uniref:ABC transporter substrate-binding protein n=1 Tax=Flavobacterium sp. TaxID=239 RepID=UPI003529BA13